MPKQQGFKHPIAILVGAALLGTSVLGAGLWYKLSGETAVEPAPPPSWGDNALISQPRPDFILADLSGTPRAASEWNGKVLAVNFWATWCPPCKREIPGFNALQNELGPKGLQIVGVAVDDQTAVHDYVQSTSIDYPVLVGDEINTIAIAEQYGNATGIMPYTVIVDRAGRIAYVHFGELSEDVARQVIKPLL